LWRATNGRRLLLGLENNVHDCIWEISLRGRAQAGQIWLGGCHTGLETGKWRCSNGRGNFQIHAGLLGAFGEAFFSLGQCGRNAAVAFGIGNVALKRIGAENQIGCRKKPAGIGILRICFDCSLQIASSGGVVSRAIGGLAGSGEGRSIFKIDPENLLILGERIGIVVSLLEKLRSLKMRGDIGWHGRGKGHHF